MDPPRRWSAVDRRPPGPEPVTVWPPADAEEIDLTGVYERFAESGFSYGPAFQGLASVWRRGEEVFAEAALPAGVRSEADRYGLHPALLDTVLHSLAFGVLEGTGQGWLPFSWHGVTLHATGASTVRLRMAPTGASSVSVLLTDGTGRRSPPPSRSCCDPPPRPGRDRTRHPRDPVPPRVDRAATARRRGRPRLRGTEVRTRRRRRRGPAGHPARARRHPRLARRGPLRRQAGLRHPRRGGAERRRRHP
ncbi:polyketide synthase dehydratase domain-containing protein [Streptomyces sp. M19]